MPANQLVFFLSLPCESTLRYNGKTRHSHLAPPTPPYCSFFFLFSSLIIITHQSLCERWKSAPPGWTSRINFFKFIPTRKIHQTSFCFFNFFNNFLKIKSGNHKIIYDDQGYLLDRSFFVSSLDDRTDRWRRYFEFYIFNIHEKIYKRRRKALTVITISGLGVCVCIFFVLWHSRKESPPPVTQRGWWWGERNN